MIDNILIHVENEKINQIFLGYLKELTNKKDWHSNCIALIVAPSVCFF